MPRYYPTPGSAPATLVLHEGRKTSPPQLHLMEYGPQHFREEDAASVHDLPLPEHTGHLLWVEMNGLGDVEALRELGEKYHLHPLALEDALYMNQRAKFERYDSHLFIVARMVYRDRENEIHTEQVSMFLGEDFLVTVQEEADFDVFEPVRARLRAERGPIRERSMDYLAYALIDSITDHVFPVLEELGNELEEVEENLMDNPRREFALQVHELKRTLMRLRRCVWPMRDLVSAMLHEESPLICDQTKVYLRDCYDHLVQIIDLLENYRETASGLMDLYHSALSTRTNEVMRVLTVISAIFIPLTFIAGVYGMNFDFDGGNKPLNMPELHAPHGYLICMLFMLAVAIGQIVWFKKKGWW